MAKVIGSLREIHLREYVAVELGLSARQSAESVAGRTALMAK